MLFSEFGLKKGLVRGLDEIGYKQATPIQEKVISIALSGKNIVGQSQTGTGKTAAFLLPVLNKIDTNNKQLQALILAPTRELVTQIGDEIRNLTKYYGVTYACLYGGASPTVQMKKLKKKPAIIVSTTGRLMDFMGQGLVDVSTVNSFILDEVDMMLDMGFVRDIKRIRASLENIKQTYTFSATMNNDMKSIIKEHISAYEFIKIGDVVTVDKINHRYISVEHEHKLINVLKLISSYSNDKIIIFTHTKKNTKTIHKVLVEAGVNAGSLNGNMGQGKRQGTLDEFKSGKLQVLVTTDVAARGLNMDNVGLVINFDVPVDAKSYIHRIGRTGRAGAYGKAIMLVSMLERTLLKDIEKMHRINVKQSDYKPIRDKYDKYGKVRLNRSTDKLGGKRLKSGFGTNKGGKNRKYRSKDIFKIEEGGFKKENKRRYSKSIGGNQSEVKNENKFKGRRNIRNEDIDNKLNRLDNSNNLGKRRFKNKKDDGGESNTKYNNKRGGDKYQKKTEGRDRNSRSKLKSKGRRFGRKR